MQLCVRICFLFLGCWPSPLCVTFWLLSEHNPWLSHTWEVALKSCGMKTGGKKKKSRKYMIKWRAFLQQMSRRKNTNESGRSLWRRSEFLFPFLSSNGVLYLFKTNFLHKKMTKKYKNNGFLLLFWDWSTKGKKKKKSSSFSQSSSTSRPLWNWKNSKYVAKPYIPKAPRYDYVSCTSQTDGGWNAIAIWVFLWSRRSRSSHPPFLLTFLSQSLQPAKAEAGSRQSCR